MSFSYLKVNPLSSVRHYINVRLCKREPALIIVVTAGTVIASIWFWEQLSNPEGMIALFHLSVFIFM